VIPLAQFGLQPPKPVAKKTPKTIKAKK